MTMKTIPISYDKRSQPIRVGNRVALPGTWWTMGPWANTLRSFEW